MGNNRDQVLAPLAVTLALLIAANVLQILRDHKDRKDEK